MTTQTIRSGACLLGIAGMALAFNACEGGCGEPAKELPAKASGVSGSSGHASGSGELSLGRNTQNAINAPIRRETLPQARAPRPEALPAPQAGAVFADVNRTLYEPKVIKALGGVLVVSYTPGCQHWSDMMAALKGLSEDLAGKVAVYRLDVSDPEQAAVLPSGMTRLPVPGFAYYESGQALGQRQGFPFERRVGKGGEPLEGPEQYQQRLRLWLRDAVAAKNFNLPEPK